MKQNFDWKYSTGLLNKGLFLSNIFSILVQFFVTSYLLPQPMFLQHKEFYQSVRNPRSLIETSSGWATTRFLSPVLRTVVDESPLPTNFQLIWLEKHLSECKRLSQISFQKQPMWDFPKSQNQTLENPGFLMI